MLLIGTTDGYANIHAPDERVVLDELERATVAEAELFDRFAAR
jgi:acetylornithine deacetylase/succinyl-diaminopimelate desuccinylase-like protein